LVLDPIQFHHLQFQHPNGALEKGVSLFPF
jgi:hypothetical protein